MTTETQHQIETLSRQFEATFAARDAHALVNGYFALDEHVPMASGPGGQPPSVGRAALIKLFEAQFEMFQSIRLQLVRLESATELAFELGLAHLTAAAGETKTGRYTVLWRRQRGEWRAQVDFFAEDGWTA